MRELRRARGTEQARLLQAQLFSRLDQSRDTMRDSEGLGLDMYSEDLLLTTQWVGLEVKGSGLLGSLECPTVRCAATVSWKHGNCDSSASHNTPCDYFYAGDQNSGGASRQSGWREEGGGSAISPHLTLLQTGLRE